MLLSTLLGLVGSAAAFATVFALVMGYRPGAAKHETLALAQSGVARLKELEHRAQSGSLDTRSVDEARRALLCELLGAYQGGRSPWWLLRGDRAGLAIIGLAALAMGCFCLLLFSGTTPSPADARTSSAQQADPDLARLELYADSKAPGLRATAPMSRRPELPDVETMIERLAARLQTTPDDAEGWRMLGWSYFHVQQPAKAADAYARAVALRPQSSEFQSAYGEAVVAAEAGAVTQKASEIFKAALALDPKNPKARYFTALAAYQAGRKQEALDAWRLLEAEPLSDESWVTELRERTQALAREFNVGVSAPAQPPAAASGGEDSGKVGGARQPTTEEIQSIQALPADQQRKMIQSMVEGLANRLQTTPRDEEGWLRLMRSRVVLGERQAAREALARALAVFTDDAAAVARIAAAARQLGVENN